MTTSFNGDAGTQIILDCGVNISTATVMSIVARKPTGVKVTWTAILEGTNSIKYVAQAGDLDTVGVWALQSYIEMPTWIGYGEVATMRVNRKL